MPPYQNEDARRAARSEAAKRGAETRRRNAAARMQQGLPRSVIVIDDEDGDEEKLNTKMASYSTRYNQSMQSRNQKRVQVWTEAGNKVSELLRVLHATPSLASKTIETQFKITPRINAMSTQDTSTGAWGAASIPTQNTSAASWTVREARTKELLTTIKRKDQIIDMLNRRWQSSYFWGVVLGLVSTLIAVIISLAISKARAAEEGFELDI
ncbi:hypothetical protein DL98DRAFT_584826 [Cadophora sp. DSE1049]|nr:hypothetical protein DL98DRAFT_584826 [Cadophora sp. DSE1049]